MRTVCLLVAIVATAQATQCAAPPLNLPLRSLSTAPGSLSHGIPVYVGTPPQQVVLTPSLQLDTTFLPRYTNSCIDTADSANDTRWDLEDRKRLCVGIYGGGFVPDLSSTFHDNRTNDQVNEEWFRKVGFSDWHFVTEMFLFADYVEAYVQQNKVLPEKRNVTSSFIFPDEGATFGGLGISALSLMPNSSLLGDLYAEGIVPSRSWTLTNESLCLGCVDEGTYTGDFHAFKPADQDKESGLPCLLQVEVEALHYLPDTGSAGAALTDKAFTTCIDPGVMFLVLPADASAKLPETSGADVKATSNGSTTFSGSPKNGSDILRFKLMGGLEVDVTILRAEMAVEESFGERVLSVETGGWGAYGEGVPVLGKAFTDSIVLRWDERAREYGIANRNSRTDEKGGLKPLGCDDFPSVGESVETPTVGIIVGSIIGGFVAGLLFAAAGFFFFWRGHKGVKSKYEAMRGEDAISLHTVNTGGRTLESRMSGAPSSSAPSIRESLRAHLRTRSISPIMEPYLVGDSQVYEAPEGGTAVPSRRDWGEMATYSNNHR